MNDTTENIAIFRRKLGEAGVVTVPSDKQAYERSARHAGGSALAVLRPGSEAELAWTLKTLAEIDGALVVQGAATGLVGAATPHSDGSQWVLSTQRVRDVLTIDPVNRCAHVSAGYRLSDLNRAAAEHGLTFPIDLGADPSIGGMVATNTGGARLIRFGGVRENLLDLRSVLVDPPGECVGSDRGLRKDNTGLNWAQLLCGTFGAFAVISRATLKLHPIQRQSATALIALPNARAAISLMCALEREFGEMISAFEGISRGALDAVRSHQRSITVPFAESPEYSVLVEVSSAIAPERGLDLEAMMMDWLERCIEGGKLEDAVIDKPAQLWRIRHAVSESVQSLGRLIAFDLSVSRSRFADFREQAIARTREMAPEIQVCDFGHLGDGAVHFNLVVPADLGDETIEVLRATLYKLTMIDFAGSFSAEHGIGPYNASYYERYSHPTTRRVAQALKQLFDPKARLGNVALG